METNKSTEPEDPNLAENITNVLPFPVAILDKIFVHLSHTEMLISRLVCKHWDIQISSILAKTSYFVLNSRESNEALLDSNVQWTKLKITETSALSQQFKTFITTLQLKFSRLPNFVTTLKNLLIGFPNVTNLHLNIGDRNSDSTSESEIERNEILAPNSIKKFKKIVERLDSLTISFPFNDCLNLEKCLREFIAVKMSLTKLSIKESSLPKTERPLSGRERMELFSRIFAIIFWSSRSLTYLELDLYSEAIRNELGPGLISHLCNLEDLKLTSVLIRFEPIEKNIDRDFLILSKFLMAQMGSGVLKNIVLPWTTNAALCQEFMRSLPKQVEFVGNFHTQHAIDGFPNGFKKLILVSIAGNINREVFGERCDIQKLHLNLIKYGLVFDVFSTSGSVRDTFTNLTELKMISTSHNINSELQIIIRHLGKLRVLHVDSCEITDYAVTGLTQLDAKELLVTKKLYFHCQLNPKQHVLRKRLGSLQMLEKLILIGTQITDVGIVLGLQFGSSLKHLMIGSRSDEVSDMGLHCIGANKSGLESFQGLFKSPQISTAGIESLKKQFPMVKSTQKFAVINESPEVTNL